MNVLACIITCCTHVPGRITLSFSAICSTLFLCCSLLVSSFSMHHWNTCTTLIS